MIKRSRPQLEEDAIKSIRHYSINFGLFRNMIGTRMGINLTDMECLGLLFYKRTATPSELGAQAGLTSGATTAMLDRLEKAGIIERKPNPNDRRGTLITVKPGIGETFGAFYAGVRKSQAEMLNKFTDKELLTIIKFLEEYATVFEDERNRLIK